MNADCIKWFWKHYCSSHGWLREEKRNVWVTASGFFHVTSCLKGFISYFTARPLYTYYSIFKMHNLFYTYNVILNSYSRHKAAVLQSPLPKVMKHSSFRQAIQLLCLLLFRSDTSVESSCSTLMTRLSCMTQRRTQSILTSRAWQHLWTALTATDNALSTAFETRHKGSNWTAFFSLL